MSEINNISNYARQLVPQFRWSEISKLADEIITLAPEDAEGYFLKGLSQARMHQPRLALESFEKALKIDDKRYDAAIELAAQYIVSKRNGDAYKLLEQYRELLDNSPRYLDSAATSYVQIGMPERATTLYERALQLQPNVEIFKGNLAACYGYVGEIEKAKNIYLELLSRNPSHQRNHYLLSRLEKVKDHSHIDQMLNYLNQSKIPDKNCIFIHSAIGKEYEDLKEWDLSFKHYKLSGDAATQVANYHCKEDTDLINTTISAFTAQWYAQTPPADDKLSKTPIFIISLPRSGSTLTERIIGSHPLVQSLGETQFLPKNIRQVTGVESQTQISNEIISQAAYADYNAIAEGYLNDIQYRLNDNPYFIEKLPYNFLFAGVITKAFPNAKLIYIDRDPIDVCFAMYKQVFTWAYKFSYDLENLAEYFNHHKKLLKHWHKLLGDKLITVQYEALVSDPEAQIKQLLKALGLEYHPDCLNFHENKSASTTASSTQIRSKIHTESVKKWTHFENHLQPLIQNLEL